MVTLPEAVELGFFMCSGISNYYHFIFRDSVHKEDDIKALITVYAEDLLKSSVKGVLGIGID